MASIKSLADEYGISVDEVRKIARSVGVIPFTPTWGLDAISEQKIRNAVNDNIGNEKVERREEEERKRREEEDRKRRESKERSEGKDDELLSRDYIVFTLSVLEKSGTQKILKEIITLRKEKNTRTKLIIVSAAIDELKADAEVDSSKKYLMENYNLFDTMRKNGWIEVLNGTIAQEGITIGNYIRQNLKDSDSILVLGKNMTLDTYIYLRNSEHMQNKDFRNPVYQDGYIPIIERTVHFSGLKNTWINPVFGCVGEEIFVRYKNEKYTPVVEIVSISEKTIPLRGAIPAEGETAYLHRNGGWHPVRLLKEISHGAEGTVFHVEDHSLCAKILFAPSITERKMKKLELICQEYENLCSRDNSVMRRIAWPQTLLYNDQHEPVGYLMRRFEGISSFENFDTHSYGEFVGNSKEKQIIAAISFVELIRFLHENNVILCDINRGNLLYDEDQRAYLVDLDSAQITEKNPYKTENGKAYYLCYPANVATPQFISPEHIDEHVYTFRHSKADDVWSMQYMIFLLLTCCGAFLPYHNDAASAEGKSDIRSGNYLYYSNYTRQHIVPEDDALFRMHCIVSRLPEELRRAFYQSFSGKGLKFHAKDRYPSKVWMIWLIKYYVELPKMLKNDTKDGEYLPETIRYSNSSGKGSKGSRDYEDLLDIFDEWRN